MVLPYNAGTIPQPNIICYQIKSLVPGMGLYLAELSVNGSQRTSPTTLQTISKDTGYYLQLDG